MAVSDRASFLFGAQIKWLLVTLGRWLSYILSNVRNLTLVDSTLVILDELSYYSGGHLSKFETY